MPSLFKKEPIVTKAQLMELAGINSDRRFKILADRGIFANKSHDAYFLVTSLSQYAKLIGAHVKKHSSVIRGRPRKYTDVRELQLKAQQYFEQCAETAEIPTISDMCNFLDLPKSTLSDYSKKADFSDTIKRMRQMVEAAMEKASMSKGSASGAIFNLKANFGYQDKQVIDLNHSGGVMVILPDNGRDKPQHPNEQE